MLPSELLAILRCPQDHSALSSASEAQINRANAAIREGRLLNAAGNRVEQFIDGGLVRADGAWLYPIVDEIPVLLRDDAISMAQLSS
jgi:uncharacterized protein YbaR (Trm112 family)